MDVVGSFGTANSGIVVVSEIESVVQTAEYCSVEI